MRRASTRTRVLLPLSLGCALLTACGDSDRELGPFTPPPDPGFEIGAGIWEFFPNLDVPLHDFGVAAYRGTIFLVGGVSQVNNTEVLQNAVYHFDWVKNAWDSLSAFPVPITLLQAVVLADTLFVVGGVTAGGNPQRGLWAYDPEADSWDSRPAMPDGRTGAAAGVADGRILVVGGFGAVDGDMFAYAPSTGTWTREPAPGARLESHVVTIGGVAFHAGGRAWNGTSASPDPSVEVYELDPGTGAWTEAARHPRARRFAAAAALGSRIHFVGGQDITNQLVTLHMAWDPATGLWYEYPPLPVERMQAKAVQFEGALYLIGGRADGSMTNLVDKFIPQ